jgi:hypothetical protein
MTILTISHVVFGMRKVCHQFSSYFTPTATSFIIRNRQEQHIQPKRNKGMVKTDSDWSGSSGKWQMENTYKPACVNTSIFQRKVELVSVYCWSPKNFKGPLKTKGRVKKLFKFQRYMP